MEFGLPRYQIEHRFSSQSAGEHGAWPLERMGIPNFWQLFPNCGRDVRVAIVDSGIDHHHPDLAENIDKVYDFTGGRGGDDDGHGTHVAGIVGALYGNDRPAVGIAHKTTINSYRAMGADGTGSARSVAKCIEQARKDGNHLCNLSLGMPGVSREVDEQINAGVAEGMVFIVAGGNTSGKLLFPANKDNVISVGATGVDNKRMSFSNYGNTLDVMAPGDKIFSTFKNGAYATLTGTSMAAPFITAIVAVLKSHDYFPAMPNGSINYLDVLEFLIGHSTDIGEPGHDPFTGHGVISPESITRRMPKPEDLLCWGGFCLTFDAETKSICFTLDDD